MECVWSGNKFKFNKSLKNTHYLHVNAWEGSCRPSKTGVALLQNMRYFRSWILVLLLPLLMDELSFIWTTISSTFLSSLGLPLKCSRQMNHILLLFSSSVGKSLFQTMEFCKKAFPKIDLTASWISNYFFTSLVHRKANNLLRLYDYVFIFRFKSRKRLLNLRNTMTESLHTVSMWRYKNEGTSEIKEQKRMVLSPFNFLLFLTWGLCPRERGHLHRGSHSLLQCTGCGKG